MTLDEAIEILADILKYIEPGYPSDECDAINVAIEALKEKLEREK